MNLLLYLVGAPGAGKTTVMEAMTFGYERRHMTGPVPHDQLVYRDDPPAAVEIGRRRGTFSGTDALPASVQTRAVDWIRSKPCPLILAEGGRLANEGFFNAVRSAGYRLLLVHLEAPDEVLADRRRAGGGRQHPGWVRSVETRARHITQRMEFAVGVQVLWLYANMHPNALAKEIVRTDPELANLLCWS